MIWWRRRRTSAETAEARRRLEAARRDLAAARAADDAVDERVRQLEHLAGRNGFGPMITRALLRGSGG